MTIAELIEELKRFPPDTPVWLDGGDWGGEIDAVESDAYDPDGSTKGRVVVSCNT